MHEYGEVGLTAAPNPTRIRHSRRSVGPSNECDRTAAATAGVGCRRSPDQVNRFASARSRDTRLALIRYRPDFFVAATEREVGVFGEGGTQRSARRVWGWCGWCRLGRHRACRWGDVCLDGGAAAGVRCPTGSRRRSRRHCPQVYLRRETQQRQRVCAYSASSR
jgi:hypothetical protein